MPAGIAREITPLHLARKLHQRYFIIEIQTDALRIAEVGLYRASARSALRIEWLDGLNAGSAAGVMAADQETIDSQVALRL